MSSFGRDFAAAYKHLYNPKRVESMAYRARPFLQRLPKRDGFEGESYHHTIFFEDPQGGSADFATAVQQKDASSQGARLIINRGREYQVIQINNEEIAASRSDVGSLLRKKNTETNRVIGEMGRRIDLALHGSGSGVIASFTTGITVGTTVVTLDSPALGIRFSSKMHLQVATNDPIDGTPPTLLGGSVKVLSVNRTATGTTLTLDAPLNTAFPGIATSTKYYLLRKGDGIGFGATRPYGGVAGLKAWLPLIAPAPGDSFWGKDRTEDTTRLSGVRYVAQAGESYEQTLIQASAEATLQGATSDVILMNPINYSKYMLSLQNRVRYTNAPNQLKDGANSVLFQGQSGDMEVIADGNVDPGLFYMLDMSTWWLFHLGGVPHLDESDGREAAREAMLDALEFRWRAWYQLICDAPGRNVVGSFAA